jgi:hypothetical protein
MCKGEAHGDLERQIMPADSNFPFEFRFGYLKFMWIKAVGFCKTGGWLPV